MILRFRAVGDDAASTSGVAAPATLLVGDTFPAVPGLKTSAIPGDDAPVIPSDSVEPIPGDDAPLSASISFAILDGAVILFCGPQAMVLRVARSATARSAPGDDTPAAPGDAGTAT